MNLPDNSGTSCLLKGYRWSLANAREMNTYYFCVHSIHGQLVTRALGAYEATFGEAKPQDVPHVAISHEQT